MDQADEIKCTVRGGIFSIDLGDKSDINRIVST